jgi:Ca2+/H+ antiporter
MGFNSAFKGLSFLVIISTFLLYIIYIYTHTHTHRHDEAYNYM